MSLGTVAAVALGVVLLASGALKLAGWSTWRSQARGLGVPAVVAVPVPVLELVLGALLVAGVGRRLAAATAGAVLVVFTAFLVRLLVAGRHPPCACFGTWSRRPIGWGSVVRNGVLVALAVVAALA